MISVPTPLRDGEPDLSFIEQAGATVGDHLRPGACVILESTTYPGTTTALLGPILAERSGLRAASPTASRASSSSATPPSGSTRATRPTAWSTRPRSSAATRPDSLAVVDAFFSTLVDTTVPVGSCAEAELVKLLENTFRHVNIALVNELAMFARDLDVDVWRAIDAAATKPFGYMKFTPGPGVGGHCLPIDPSYLAWRVKQHLGQTFRFVELANDVNEHMPDYVHDRVAAMLNRERKAINGSRILLLGLAYKRSTSDWRESPSVHVADRLAASGADVRFCDPHIPEVNAHGARAPARAVRAPRTRAPPTSSSCSSTTRSSIQRRSPRTAASCSTRRTTSPATSSTASSSDDGRTVDCDRTDTTGSRSCTC